MTIYVDEPQTWKVKFANYCHMWSSTNNVEELHAFAARLGLKRSWFQGHHARFPHYDISLNKRNHVLKLGAEYKSLIDWLAEQKQMEKK